MATYIGGELNQLPESYWEDENNEQEQRYLEQQSFINKRRPNYIVYYPESNFFMFSDGDLSEIAERMAIKEGIDVIEYSDNIHVVAYYGASRETAYMFPLSDEKISEIKEILSKSDFDESTTIEMEIAQHAYTGASVKDILCSWTD